MNGIFFLHGAYQASVQKLLALANPKLRHATSASASVKNVPHTVIHRPWTTTSRRPETDDDKDEYDSFDKRTSKSCCGKAVAEGQKGRGSGFEQEKYKRKEEWKEMRSGRR